MYRTLILLFITLLPMPIYHLFISSQETNYVNYVIFENKYLKAKTYGNSITEAYS